MAQVIGYLQGGALLSGTNESAAPLPVGYNRLPEFDGVGAAAVPVLAATSPGGGVGFGNGSIQPPSGFDRWDFDRYPVNVSRINGVVTTDFEPRKWVNPLCWSGPVYHVDPLNGSDSNSGLGSYIDDYSAAKKSLRGAQLAINTAGVPARIRVKYRPGVISNRSDGGGAMYVAPSVSTVVEGVGGRPMFGCYDNLTWSVHSGTTYTATRSNIGVVVDLLSLRESEVQAGRAPDLTAFVKLADAAAVVASSGNSWAQVGSLVYVKRADGAAVTNANTAAGLLAPELGYDNDSVGGCGMWNIAMLVGGNASFGVRNSVIARDYRDFIFVGCVAARSCANLFRLESSPGLIALVGCSGFGGGADAYNQHHYLAEPSRMHFLRIDCDGASNGSPGVQSCNSFTGHETTFEIGINDVGSRSFGAEAAYIDDAQAWLINPTISDPRGDVVNGGGVVPTAVWAAGTASVWVDGGSVSSPDRAYRAGNTAVIKTRGTTVVAGITLADAGATVTTY